MKEMKDRPFALIGVNSDDLDRARAAVKEHQLNWRNFQNRPEGSKTKISDDWLLNGWPTIVVLDADRRIRYRGLDCHEGTRIARELVSAMED
ncbi:MAG: hypothetical protein ISQ11_03445 [Planctomycetes bacterium]|nr:hypothetical protein [Planctomycetota bacterium]